MDMENYEQLDGGQTKFPPEAYTWRGKVIPKETWERRQDIIWGVGYFVLGLIVAAIFAGIGFLLAQSSSGDGTMMSNAMQWLSGMFYFIAVGEAIGLTILAIITVKPPAALR